MSDRVGLLLPGLPQLLRGRWLEGATALALWTGLLALVVVRFPRVAGALSGELDERVALLTLLLVLGGVWLWARGQARGSRPGSGSTPGRRRWGRLWGTFKKNRLAVLGFWIVSSFSLAALLAPLLAPSDPFHLPAFQGAGTGLRMAAPSSAHLLGTDHLSRDVLSRILYGSRISLSIGFLAVAVSVTGGAFLGAVAGYLGGWVDWVVMRTVDMFMAFPRLVLLIAIVALFERSFFLVVAALAVTQWPFPARVVRGEILSLKEREFAEAARALGFSRRRIIFRHLLPNAMAPVIVAASLGIGNTIILEAGLSFLGLGVEASAASWGLMVSEGRSYLTNAWWISTFPGLAIVFVVVGFNLVGDGLRDALDPKQVAEARG